MAGDPTPSPRDRHLFGPGPKRILSLDGGGVRGAITIAFLERMEALASGRGDGEVRLDETFDLIGGTSTGAIIGGALALGHRAGEVRGFYERLAPRVFKRSFLRIAGLQAKFDARGLQAELDAVIGERRLDTADLRTGFSLVMKRMDTGSPWIVSNNPGGRFWDAPADGSHLGNRSFLLSRLIRASTAAPHYFDPEPLDVMGDGSLGLFVDGGVTPFNNPSLQLFLLATLPQHGLNWALGPDRLTIVSVGTGSFRDRLAPGQEKRIGAIGLAVKALAGLISDSQSLTLGLMQTLGETPTPWILNSEVGTMEGLRLPGGPLFRFVRYDVRLERDWLRDELGLDLDAATVRRLRMMDDPAGIPLAYRIAQAAAEKQVKIEHFAVAEMSNGGG